jgi:hypothetical protein
MSRRFPSLFYNPVSLAGLAVAGVSFGLIFFLFLLELFSGEQKPYMGIIAFVILPGFLLLGLAILFYGAWREQRRRRSGEASEIVLPRIDLNEPRQRRAFVAISVGSLLLLLFSAFGSFKAYEYTDSDQFCGELCHSVMEPEYTAYRGSPHAHVGCVKCHIGPGAGWFVRSKLSGAYQVYATLFNTFPRPIPTPIENLRPAQETCEQCHWPQHFFDQKLKTINYYLSDAENTPWHLKMIIKTGGGTVESGPTSGIHWHMNIANEITYAAADRGRQKIPWVHVRSREGVERTYRDPDAELSAEELEALPKRRMDCIDCHNRPTHIYRTPRQSLNELIDQGIVDRTLPFIKSLGNRVLEARYSSRAGALDSIRLAVLEYYETTHPELASKQRDQIDQAIAAFQRVYRRNYFPEMQHDWRQYPDHIGHLTSPGCFRCHDDRHVSDDGRVLTNDCNVCHVILEQRYEREVLKSSFSGLEYEHPVDVGDAWREMLCSDCHAETP